MKVLFSLLAVVLLVMIGYIGAQTYLFGVIIPYLALATFLVGIIYRIVKWARSPVPFRIPTTCGQQKSLPWIKNNNLENPSCGFGVLGRMFLEVFFFRSLFRNTYMEIRDKRIVYGGSKWLWFFGLIFHYSFLVIFLRHFRFFTEPAPLFVGWINALDGFMEFAIPTIFVSDMMLFLAATYLFIRRIWIPQMRYISLPADYFPLFLIIGIAVTGVMMRHFTKVDLTAVKSLAVGLFSFSPVLPASIGSVFYIHLFLVSVLLIYFPMSKLLHMPGVFMSPTRNLANNSRAVRHENPWNYPVKTHSYQAYEDEFREVMKACNLPLEKE